MADNGDFKLQISYKLGPNYADMLNVRANDASDLSSLLKTLQEEVGDGGSTVQDIIETGALLRAAGNAAPLTVPQQAAPASDVPPTNGSVPSCVHGPRKYVPAGVSKRTGNAYPAFWGCEAPQGTFPKCKPVTP